MRLARRALIFALAMLTLCAAVSAQTLRSEADPRNIAPTVGTGGPPGGPTGLFTVYDGQTLRKGEFTISFAYSNYDRDPGNVDITETPSSFQVGLNDYLEVFFGSDGYRGIKVNSPRNLSSFYLPNARFYNAGKIVLAPNRVSGPNIVSATGSNAVFSPVGNQPLVAFPFVGGASGNYGEKSPNGGFVGTLGARGGGNGRFSGASFFPGIGSVVGSILPGVVLSTGIGGATTSTTLPTTVPKVYSTTPSYLPDAPFIDRTYGQSSFSTFVAGAKIRLTSPDTALGFGVIPFYRFYADKASDSSGFNMLQRGASPGGSIGDFGLMAFLDGRLSRSVNMSVNAGYILNSNPRSSAFGSNKVTLLDRPNEFQAALGMDFPINKYFQPIVELRADKYVGSRTPNAFENSPIDGLVGIRVFPRRYMGFSAAYRRHLNQQSASRFSGTVPSGFLESDDPSGFLGQFFIGHRNARAPEFLPNQPPTVSLSANNTKVVVCPRDASLAQTTVQLATQATDPDGDTLLYTYSTTGGRITGEGPNVSWDLSGVQPGTYTSTVEVNDGCGCTSFSTTTVTVETCPEPTPTPAPPPCPTISVDCPTGVTQQGTPVTFTANVAGGTGTPTFNWTVSSGTITSGQGTTSITVDTAGVEGTVTATVNVGGLDASCTSSASCSASIGKPTGPEKLDQFDFISFDDAKARLDNFAIQLQNNPGSSGTIIVYAGPRDRRGEATRVGTRLQNYLVQNRGIEAGRINVVDGGLREKKAVELYVVPSGATAPAASPTVDASQAAPAPRRGRRPRRR